MYNILHQKNIFIFAVLYLAFPNIILADCDALLQVGIYNVSQSSSASEGRSLAKSTFCQADYSLDSTSTSVKARIKASFGLFGGGASGDVTTQEIVQRQRQVCTSGFNFNTYSNQATNYSKTIYQGALDAWNQCNALSVKGLKFELQTDNTLLGIAVSLSTAVGTASKFTGLTQTGLGTSVCKTTSGTGIVSTLTESSVFPINSTSKLTVICKRVVNSDATGNLFADAQGLIFNTATGPYIVPLSSIGSLARASVDKVEAKIRTAVDTDTVALLNISQTQIDQKIAKLKAEILVAINKLKGDTQTSINSINSTVNNLKSSVGNIDPKINYTSQDFHSNGICGINDIVVSDAEKTLCFTSDEVGVAYTNLQVSGNKWLFSATYNRPPEGGCDNSSVKVICFKVVK